MTSKRDPIDPDVADLVLAMNENRLVKTIASCQGHPYKLYDPYVYFATSEAVATRIESALRQWTRGPEKRLCAQWQLIGHFNSECQLRFRLMAWEHHHSCLSFWWPMVFMFKKRQIKRDLKVLADLFRQAFQPVSQEDNEVIVNVERSPGYSEAGYAQLWCHKGQVVLIMGNTVQERRDGTRWLWSANWSTGERINAPVSELEAYEGTTPSLLEVVRQVEKWAHEGNGDAMWWLGDFYEFGSRATGANGGKALAYYLGAIRCEPEWYDQGTVSRVLQDGMELFRAGHPEGVEDKTPTDTRAFLSKFREFRAIDSEGRIYYPDTKDWRECVAIAEALQ